MRRREIVVASLGAAAAVPLLLAQTPATVRKIGYLHPRTIAPDHATLKILRPEWQRLGYVEGKSLLLRSGGGDAQRMSGAVAELIGHGVGVLIVVGPSTLLAASRVTKTVPIIAIDLETDPISAGYAASFGRPGGNVSGLFLDQPSIAGKWIELLREVAPDIGRVVLLWDRSAGVNQLEIAKIAAKAKGFDAVVLEMGQISDFDAALQTFEGRPRTGVVQIGTAGFGAVAGQFAAAARKHHLPTIGFLKNYAQAGLLMSYGPVQERYFGRAVLMADKVLKGANVAQMPIEGPDYFELVINMASAKAIGLKIPQALLLRADEVIQ